MANRPVCLGAGAALAVLALGACVPRSAPRVPAPPPPLPAPAPPPPRTVPPAGPPSDWQTGQLSGDWRYQPSPGTPLAVYSAQGFSFTLRCQQGRAIWLGVTGAQGDALVIRTSYGVRRLPAERVHLNEMMAQLPTSDPLLEQMAFSRGRFMVTVEGGPSLVVASWPEIGRVIEDCRGRPAADQ